MLENIFIYLLYEYIDKKINSWYYNVNLINERSCNMKPELLVPAGNFDCLKAAIEGGCDAVYLGGKLFGARAFSDNFKDDEIKEAIKYAHLYGVKVYVTVNTLIYETEVEKFLKYIEFLHQNNVDAIILQDIGMMDLIRKIYPNLEIHASTQMHIHNLEGAKLIESLGLKRVVLARETPIQLVEEIKKNTNIELEVFVQGALCISYSGQCLMSSLIGNRSGNRGSCAGCCRQKYNLIVNTKKVNNDEYILSTKDLCSIESIGDLIDMGITSFKIEGRMKSKEYVYLVTKIYRLAIDSYIKNGKIKINNEDIKKLKTIFNRGFTKGFLNNAKNNEITNSYRPNHQGIEIGKVIKSQNNSIYIKLNDDLNINDGIRIKDYDIGFIVTQILKDGRRVKHAKDGDIVSIYCNKNIVQDTVVLKTTDYLLNKEISEKINSYSRKVVLNAEVEAFIGKPLILKISDLKRIIIISGNVVECAINAPMTKEKIRMQINKTGDTIYKFDEISIIGDEDIFISIKEINELRRKAIDKLNEERLYNINFIKKEYYIDVPDFKKESNCNILINNIYQYKMLKDYKFKFIFLENDLYDQIDDTRKVLKLPRVIEKHLDYNSPLLVGELGSVNKYNDIMTDFSFNVTNSYSVALLHSLGVKMVTLSYELTDAQIKNLVDAYISRYKKKPNLELIIFGKEEAMISKFNLNELYTVDNSYLQDRFNNMYPIIIRNDLMYIYNYKTRLLSNYNNYFKMGINNLRINVLENKEINYITNIIKNININ